MDCLIRVVEGKLGSGKTFFAVKKAVDALSQGQVVVSNVKLDWDMVDRRLRKMGCEVPRNNYRFIETQEIADDPETLKAVLCKDAFLLIDEIHLIFDSRNWKQNADKGGNFQVLITQARKLRIDMWFISQASTRIDGRIRDQATHIVRCTNWRHLPILGTLFRFPITLAKICKPNGNEVLAREWIWRNAKIGNLYDTHQTFLGIQLDGEAPAEVRGKRRREVSYGFILAFAGSCMLLLSRYLDYREEKNRKDLPSEQVKKAAQGVTEKPVEPVKAPPVSPAPSSRELSQYEQWRMDERRREQEAVTRRQLVQLQEQLPGVYKVHSTYITLWGGFEIHPGTYWLDGTVTGWEEQGGTILVSINSKVIPQVRLFYGYSRKPLQYDYNGGIARGSGRGYGGTNTEMVPVSPGSAFGSRGLSMDSGTVLGTLTQSIGGPSYQPGHEHSVVNKPARYESEVYIPESRRPKTMTENK